MSKVVVTGAAGFIGSDLVRALLKQGREVRALDNISRGSKANLVGLDSNDDWLHDRTDKTENHQSNLDETSR